MHRTRFLAAAITSFALAVSPVAVPAQAQESLYDESFGGVSTTELGGNFSDVFWAKDRESRYSYFDEYSAGGTLLGRIATDVYVGGQAVSWNPSATTPEYVGDSVVYTHTDPRTGVEVTRTFTLDPQTSQLTVTVEVAGTEPTPLDVTVDLAHRMDLAVGGDFVAEQTAPDSVAVATATPGYEAEVTFPGADRVTFAEALHQAKGDTVPDTQSDNTQLGRWDFTRISAANPASATMTVQLSSPEEAYDQDGDGIPDRWEIDGAVINGQSFPLHEWGADPTRPDLFLQLNWIDSEWSTLGCRYEDGFEATPTTVTEDFAQCSTANTNRYRPSRDSLMDLVDQFDQTGVNLHVDAGYWFTNIPNYGVPHGGGSLPYTQGFFDDDVSIDQGLQDNLDELVGPERKNIFCVGVIGDQLRTDRWASGVALPDTGSFFVSNNERMGEHNVRNTIMHEYGHTMGLGHGGPDTFENSDVMRGLQHVSLMNYLYQFDKNVTNFYTEAGAQNYLNNIGINQTTTYPDEWEHLDEARGDIGDADAVLGAEPVPDEELLEAETMKLEVAAAVANNGEVGFRVEGDTGLIAARNDNTIDVVLRNKGVEAHNFTIDYFYNGKKYSTPPLTVDGVDIYDAGLSRNDPNYVAEVDGLVHEEVITLPMPDLVGIEGPSLPVTFQVKNEAGEIKYNDTLEFSLLDLSPGELAALADDPSTTDAQREILNDMVQDAETVVAPDSVEVSTTNEPLPDNAPGTEPVNEQTTAPQRDAITPPVPANTTVNAPDSSSTPQGLLGLGVALAAIAGLVFLLLGSLAGDGFIGF